MQEYVDEYDATLNPLNYFQYDVDMNFLRTGSLASGQSSLI